MGFRILASSSAGHSAVPFDQQGYAHHRRRFGQVWVFGGASTVRGRRVGLGGATYFLPARRELRAIWPIFCVYFRGASAYFVANLGRRRWGRRQSGRPRRSRFRRRLLRERRQRRQPKKKKKKEKETAPTPRTRGGTRRPPRRGPQRRLPGTSQARQRLRPRLLL